MSKPRKLRVYFIILGRDPFYKEVSSPEEARAVIDGIADFMNFLVNDGIFPDHCNVAGLEEYDERFHEWCEWYDENGCDLDEHFEKVGA